MSKARLIHVVYRVRSEESPSSRRCSQSSSSLTDVGAGAGGSGSRFVVSCVVHTLDNLGSVCFGLTTPDKRKSFRSAT